MIRNSGEKRRKKNALLKSKDKHRKKIFFRVYKNASTQKLLKCLSK
jgi:hypothetical protein